MRSELEKGPWRGDEGWGEGGGDGVGEGVGEVMMKREGSVPVPYLRTLLLFSAGIKKREVVSIFSLLFWASFFLFFFLFSINYLAISEKRNTKYIRKLESPDIQGFLQIMRIAIRVTG